MREELDKALVEKYPNLYRDRHGDMYNTAMCWGFDVGDGWYSILDTLSAQLEKEIIKYRNKYPQYEPPCASQVKEKFGGLRFYMDRSTDEMEWYIEEAEEKAWRTCEPCGAPGVSRPTGWIQVLCNTCYLKNLACKIEDNLSSRLVLTEFKSDYSDRKWSRLAVPADKKEEYYTAMSNLLKHHIKMTSATKVAPNYKDKKPLLARLSYYFKWKVSPKFKQYWWRNLYWNKKRAIKKFIWKLKRKYGLDS